MVETVFTYGIVALGAVYVFALLVLYGGLRKTAASLAQRKSNFSPQSLPQVSVVVSARNEAHNLPRLISCLVQQDYPREKYEVIIIDDRSQDETWGVLQTASQEHMCIRTLRIGDVVPGFAPKKRAIDFAIRNANGEIILLTDADCTPPPTWVRMMVSYYDEGVAGVIGYSPYRFVIPFSRLLQGILSLDYFSLFAVAAASAGLGRALTASGTNFSYRKQTYFDIGGFDAVKEMISGDDDLLVNEVARRNAGRFSFALDPRAYVPAAAPKSCRQFWNQRIRYASKGKHYGGAMTVGLVAVYLLNAFIVVGWVSPLLGTSSLLWPSVVIWGIKSAIELIFLSIAAGLFNERSLLKYFPPAALLHPLYITVFGLLGLFAKFRWKE